MKPKKNIFIRPRKDRGNRWEVDARLPAGSSPARIRKMFETEEEAHAFAAELAPRLSSVEPIRDQSLTLGQAFERYFESKARKRSLKEDRRIAEHLKAAFGEKTRLRDITSSRIAAYKAKRLAAKSERRKDEDGKARPLGAASINRPLALLRHLLTLACEEWECIPKVPVIKLEKEAEGRVRWLEPDEEARLDAACKESQTKHLHNVVTVLKETGMRPGECLGLTWDRVDLSRGVLRLEITKSGKRREIAMRQVVYNILSAMPTKSGRVWPTGSIRTAFETAVERAKLDAPFVLYDCRHHFASWFMMRGGDLLALSKILGHATVQMTQKYAHLSPAHLRGQMEKTSGASGNQLWEPEGGRVLVSTGAGGGS
jgi:integrase